MNAKDQGQSNSAVAQATTTALEMQFNSLKDKGLKYFSTFSGIGGIELGIQQAYVGISETEGKQQRRLEREGSNAVYEQEQMASQPLCVGYSEIDKYAIQIYEKHFNHKNYGDITKINEKTLPDFDLFVGGFPCQSFSIAGKRKGFDDTRGTLFFDICRILKEKQPRLVLLENVKGLLSHDKGRTFRVIITTLDELGYDLQWQVLNSSSWVPQNRERVFIVGHLRGTPRPEVFPFQESDRGSDETLRKGTRILAGALRARDYKGGGNLIQLNNPRHSNNRVYDKNGISPSLNTAQGGNRQPKILEEDEIRRLTPKECERLQGFPDDWTKTGAVKNMWDLGVNEKRDGEIEISDTQRYKCLGNAVTVDVIEAIMFKILKHEEKKG